jgi:hypothetical protein
VPRLATPPPEPSAEFLVTVELLMETSPALEIPPPEPSASFPEIVELVKAALPSSAELPRLKTPPPPP